jgi:hypothetical protein
LKFATLPRDRKWHISKLATLPRAPYQPHAKNNHGISDGMSAASLIMDETMMVYQYCRYITDNGYQVGIYNHHGLLF